MPKDDLLRDLQSPQKIVRVFALEDVLKSGSSKEILEALTLRQTLEKDEECLILLSHALNIVQGRLMETPENFVEVSDGEDFNTRYLSLDPGKRMNLIVRAPREKLQIFSQTVPDLLSEERNPFLVSALMRVFGPHWPEDRLEGLVRYITSKNLNIRKAALQILVQKAPQIIAGYLPNFLASKNPRIRHIAIQGLYKIDPRTAISQIEKLLLSEHSSLRFLGLQNCALLSFSETRQMVLKYLAAESDLNLLEWAGSILTSNPDSQIPFQLLGLCENALAEKKKVITKIMYKVIDVLENSGKIQIGRKEYIEQLQDWVKNRKGIHYVKVCIERFEHLGEAPDPELEASIIKDLRHDHIMEAFKAAMEGSIQPVARDRIKDLLNKFGQSSQASPVTGKAVFEDLSKNEKIRLVPSSGKEDLEENFSVLEKLPQQPNTLDDLRSSAFRAAKRLDLIGKPRQKSSAGESLKSLQAGQSSFYNSWQFGLAIFFSLCFCFYLLDDRTGQPRNIVPQRENVKQLVAFNGVILGKSLIRNELRAKADDGSIVNLRVDSNQHQTFNAGDRVKVEGAFLGYEASREVLAKAQIIQRE